MSPELLDGLVVISVITVATCFLCPILCWVLTFGLPTVEHS